MIALTSSFRRPAEIERLLDCICAQTVPCAAVVIADNDGESPLAELVRNYSARPGSLKTVYLPNPGNPGCGGGLKAGEELILEQFGTANYIWVLDDDAVPEPDCLEKLLEAFSQEAAGMAVPAYHSDCTGKPLLVVDPPAQRRKIKKLPYENQLAVLPPRFRVHWATGVCQLVSMEAVQKLGVHRTDFWMQGEDIEYSHRISMALGVVAVRDCIVGHSRTGNPPPPSESEHARSFLALLQNLSYMAFHIPQGLRRFLLTWALSLGRYFRTFPNHPQWLVLAWMASLAGSVQGRPAGLPPGPAIRDRVH
ncbi:MAG: glycosyltransferase [Verrucomicrobia bacterium]|nr:glycosyltransferase [Verrucomicrobiota bacterium]